MYLSNQTPAFKLVARLKLKEEPFSVFAAAAKEDIQSLWDNVKQIDSLERSDTTKALTKGKKEFQGFIMQSHCRIHHYMFSVMTLPVVFASPLRLLLMFSVKFTTQFLMVTGTKILKSCMEVKQVRSIANLFPLLE